MSKDQFVAYCTKPANLDDPVVKEANGRVYRQYEILPEDEFLSRLVGQYDYLQKIRAEERYQAEQSQKSSTTKASCSDIGKTPSV